MDGYCLKVTGLERKEIALAISEALGAPVKYAGPPSFAYEVGACSIDRDSWITMPANDMLPQVLLALKEKGLRAEGEGCIVLSLDKHSGASLRNLVNIISSKDKLLQRALGRAETIVPREFVEYLNSVPIETVEDFQRVIAGQSSGALKFDFENSAIRFGFYNATLEVNEVKAYLALSRALDEQAKKLKYSSFLQKEAENEKYAFRCFLLRLGFIGDELKAERKLLLSKLNGNGAFKVKPAKEGEDSAC